MKANITKIVFTITALCFFSFWAFANETWTNFTNGNNVFSIVVRDNYFWCATYGGGVRWNTTDGSYVKYTSFNGLASNFVTSVAIAPNSVLWCGSTSCINKPVAVFLYYFPYTRMVHVALII